MPRPTTAVPTVTDAPVRVVLAGGGTGGHLYPALAVADALRQLAPNADVRFLGSANGIEARVLPERGEPYWLIDATRLRGLGPVRTAVSAARLVRGIGAAAVCLRGFRPQFVLGVGGYASGAGIVAASILRIPRAIHEQNAVAGWTNRIAGKFVPRVFTSFSAADGAWSAGKVACVGNPVRPEIEAVSSRGLRGQGDGVLRVLVLGGSQGAQFLNEQLPALIGLVARQRTVAVVHQCGRDNEEAVRTSYRLEAPKVDVRVQDFIGDMTKAYGWADIAVCRAGASTVAELSAVGLPAVLVPFPYAAGDHQTANARHLVDAGGAWLAPQSEWTGARWADLLGSIERADLRRRGLALRAQHAGRAAYRIAREILNAAGVGGGQ